MDTITERRRTDVKGRVARMTFPAREALTDFIGDFPCNLIGHHWVEIPRVLRVSRHSDGARMRFKCSRCYLTGGFSN